MNLDGVRQLIMESDIDDWHVIGCWGANSGPSFLEHHGVEFGRRVEWDRS
ncbi:MAG: hypothetical protein WBA45_14810 [Microthrixaceae bacterium]